MSYPSSSYPSAYKKQMLVSTEDFSLLRYNTMKSSECQPRNMSPPFAGSKNKPSRTLFVTSFMPTSWLAYSSTLKMEGTRSSAMSDDGLWAVKSQKIKLFIITL
jgi:hypothetical protein